MTIHSLHRVAKRLAFALVLGTACEPRAPAAAVGQLKWTFATDGKISSSPAVGADGTVYFGSDDHMVYALDGATGRKRWEFATGNWVTSSPAIGADGTIYVGSADFRVYALDGATGRKKWEYLTGYAVHSSPAIGPDGTVYIGSRDNRLYALNGATGQEEWEFLTTAPLYASPAIGVDGTVYVGSGYGGGETKLYALDGVTGRKKWEFLAGGDLFSSPAVGVDGMVYFGSFDHRLYALDGATGRQKWAFLAGGWVNSSPAMGHAGAIYVLSDDGRLYALDAATGAEKWTFMTTGGGGACSPAIGADGTVHFMSNGGTVYAVDGATGLKHWEFRTGGGYWSSPAIAPDGTVYVGSSDGKLYALQGSAGLADSPWPKFRRNARNTGRVEIASVPPQITGQPEDQTVPVGGTTSFSVTATGTPPLTYRWRTNGVALTAASSASLTLANVQPNQAGTYSVVVANDLGAVTSRVARLTVMSPPSIRLVTNVVVVGTLAGSGTAGYQDGLAAQAQFNAPNGGCVDAAGSVYVADGDNHRIRKITLDGRVTTIAGTGVSGYADGPAGTSQFAYPLGVCVDRAGSVYIADAGNNRVRKIGTDGSVSTVAGTGVGGYRDGPGTTAWLNFPNDLVVDAAGNLFVTEYDNHTVRRIAPDGMVSTWVGNGQPASADGPRAAAGLTQPGGIALDPEGNLYVTEYGGHRVRKVSVSGIVSTLAGTGTGGYRDGEGSQAQFRNPDGIVVDTQGYAYVADNGNHVIRRILPTGLVETLAGTGTAGRVDGFQPIAQFARPTGIGLLTHGVFCVTDGGNHQVRWIVLEPRLVVITGDPQSQSVPAGTNVTFSVSASGTPPLRYQWRREGTNLPGATAASLVLSNVQPAQGGSYSVVVSNLLSTLPSQVAMLTVIPSARPVAGSVAVSAWAGSGVAGSADGPPAEAQFNGPNGGCVDGAGNVYVADANNHRIRRIAPHGTVTTLAGTGASGFADGPADQAQFSYPLGVCVDHTGNVYVADAGNNRVRRINPEGLVTTLAGTGVGGYRDGPGSSAWLNYPNDLVADDAGNLWVTEYDNHTVRRIAPDGMVNTWVGNGQPGYVDGPRSEARLTQPGGIALDSTGNLYVTEYGGHRVRKVSASGVVSTLAGTGVAGYLDGEGAKAQFRNPDGIVVGALGYVYVADNGNHAIRRISPSGYVETVAGTGEAGYAEGMATAAQFANPSGIGVGANGVVYVTDGMNQRVRRLIPPGLQLHWLGNALVVNWPGAGWALQVNTNLGLASAWQDVPRVTNGPVIVPLEAPGSRFYRLREASVSGGSGTAGEPANPDPARLVWISAGTFTMGSPPSEPDRMPWEGPQTKVTLSKGFWLGQHEVTQGEYQAVMGNNPSYFKGDLDRPVEQVSWSDATDYCGRLTARERSEGRLPAGYEYRLPTEAQWDYACRAGTTTATAFGDSLSSTQANFYGDYPCNGGAQGPYLERTTKVGSYAPNAWGLHDMHGNVWEWCQDWSSDAYPGGSVTDPKGPASGSGRVFRGGGWSFLGLYCRSAFRAGYFPDVRSDDLGFRAALVQVP